MQKNNVEKEENDRKSAEQIINIILKQWRYNVDWARNGAQRNWKFTK